MTQVYKCDICGSLNEYDDNNVLTNKDKTLHADLCASCAADVLEFIHDERENQNAIEPQAMSAEQELEKAKATLKQYGFVYYKAPATRNRKKK